MRADQVLDMQMDLFTRLDKDEKFQKVVKYSLGAAIEADATHIVKALRGHMRTGYAYRVTDDMSLLVQFAADQLDDSDRFDRDNAPTQCGIVRFDRPLPLIDARGKQMLIHWATWGPCSTYGSGAFGQKIEAPGLLLTFWNDTNFPDEIALDIMKKQGVKQMATVIKSLGRWGFIGAELVYTGKRLGGKTHTLDMDTVIRIMADGDTPSQFTNTSRYIHALFLLLNQTLPDVREDRIPKSAISRIRKMPIPHRVTVISLRRKEYERRESESQVEWSHRWVVRGFWRWQPYGSRTNPEYKRIWIAPFVKGPQGKPLIISDKLYDFRR